MAIELEPPSNGASNGKGSVTDTLKHHTTDAPYVLASGTYTGEIHRLNSQHTAIQAYFAGSNSSGAPWPSNPRRILELSLGSGVWAEEVARQFPGAEVVGVDIVQPVLEDPPSNFIFHHLDVVRDPWPFPPNHFDIIHCRFLCMHIPHYRLLMDKALLSCSPGGVVMFEDMELQPRSEGGKVPYAAGFFFSVFHGFAEQNGVDDRPGPGFAPYMIGSRGYAQVQETVVPVPFGDWPEDERLHVIGRGMRMGMIQGARTLSGKMHEFGVTREMVERMVGELMRGEEWRGYMDYYSVWGRKKGFSRG